MTTEHFDEVDRLWRLIRRDLGSAIMEFAGYQDGAASNRLSKNWRRLCDLDLDVAGRIYHGIEQIHLRMGHDGRAPDHQARQLSEFLGVVTAGRDANPDVAVETVGDLYALGEQALRDEVERGIEGAS